jgi:hypothetical protein
VGKQRVEWVVEVKRGVMKIPQRDILDGLIHGLDDGLYSFELRHEKAETSYRQMQKYWHAVPVEICRKEFGLQHDPMHYALLGQCWGHIDSQFGPVPIVASSSKLTREQWTQMIDWVLDWGPSEHGLVIPEPDSAKAKTLIAQYHRASLKAQRAA